jgi:hypothetical protein
MGWINFFERQPPGWKEDLRTYYIMRSMNEIKAKPEDIFPSIKQLKTNDNAEEPGSVDSFKASPLFKQFDEAFKKAGKEI